MRRRSKSRNKREGNGSVNGSYYINSSMYAVAAALERRSTLSKCSGWRVSATPNEARLRRGGVPRGEASENA